MEERCRSCHYWMKKSLCPKEDQSEFAKITGNNVTCKKFLSVEDVYRRVRSRFELLVLE